MHISTEYVQQLVNGWARSLSLEQISTRAKYELFIKLNQEFRLQLRDCNSHYNGSVSISGANNFNNLPIHRYRC